MGFLCEYECVCCTRWSWIIARSSVRARARAPRSLRPSQPASQRENAAKEKTSRGDRDTSARVPPVRTSGPALYVRTVAVARAVVGSFRPIHGRRSKARARVRGRVCAHNTHYLVAHTFAELPPRPAVVVARLQRGAVNLYAIVSHQKRYITRCVRTDTICARWRT